MRHVNRFWENAIRSIAQDALDGIDINDRVANVAHIFQLDPSLITHLVDEAIDDIRFEGATASAA